MRPSHDQTVFYYLRWKLAAVEVPEAGPDSKPNGPNVRGTLEMPGKNHS